MVGKAEDTRSRQEPHVSLVIWCASRDGSGPTGGTRSGHFPWIHSFFHTLPPALISNSSHFYLQNIPTFVHACPLLCQHSSPGYDQLSFGQLQQMDIIFHDKSECSPTWDPLRIFLPTWNKSKLFSVAYRPYLFGAPAQFSSLTIDHPDMLTRLSPITLLSAPMFALALSSA